MRTNKIKQIWRDGKCATLGWLSVSHGFTAEVMARQGFDALCVDLQHGLSEMKDVAPMLQAISQTDTVPVVRVAWNEPAAIMKALDLGAYGIIVPLVNNAQEAAMAVAACRYPPVGMRSNGPVRAVHAFVKMPGLEVASAQGLPQHALCKAAMGVSFAAGTTDGPGMFNFEQGQGNSSNPLWRFIGGARCRGRAAVGTAVTVPVECFYARP